MLGPGGSSRDAAESYWRGLALFKRHARVRCTSAQCITCARAAETDDVEKCTAPENENEIGPHHGPVATARRIVTPPEYEIDFATYEFYGKLQ